MTDLPALALLAMTADDVARKISDGHLTATDALVLAAPAQHLRIAVAVIDDALDAADEASPGQRA